MTGMHGRSRCKPCVLVTLLESLAKKLPCERTTLFLVPSALSPLDTRFRTLAPFAATYVPPADVPRSDGPVSIVLSLGPHDETSELMEWDKVEVPESATVLDALRHLRSEDGHAGMQIDMPWELDGSWWSEGGPLAVVGALLSSFSLRTRLKSFHRHKRTH